MAKRTTQQKIRTRSTALLVIMLIIACVCLSAAIGCTKEASVGYHELGDVLWQDKDLPNILARPFMYLSGTALCLVCAHTFYNMRKHQNAFIPGIPRRIRIIALLLFTTTVLPYFFATIIKNWQLGTFGFVFVSNENFLGFIVSLVVYCLAPIFEHGLNLQQENDELL